MSGESVNRKCIESLIKAGAFDNFNQTRSTLLASFEGVIDTINDTSRKTMQGQVTMFDLQNEEDKKIEDLKYNFVVIEEFDEKELLSMEKEMLGIYISGHPLSKVKDKIEKVATINTIKMLQMKEENNFKEDGKSVKYVGIVTSVKKKYTKKNTLMAFVTVEDLYGTCEIIVFDSCYSKAQNILLNENVVLIDGRLSIREDDDVKIVANNIVEFNADMVKENNIEDKSKDENKRITKIIINITNLEENKKEHLRGAIKFFGGDKNNVAIFVKQDEQILNCGAIYMNNRILEQFKEIAGEENVELE